MNNKVNMVAFIFFLISSPMLHANNTITGKLNLDNIFDSLPNKEQKLEGAFTLFKDKIAINIKKSQTVNMLCGRSMYFLKSLSMSVLKDGVRLNPSSDNAAFNFKSEKELSNCIGNGSKFSFPRDMWISLFGNEYQDGGFNISKGKFSFWKGTKGRIQQNIVRIYNGKKWIKEGSISTLNNHGFSKVKLQKVQSRLNGLGYNCGTPDGLWGKKSASALKLFQRDSGILESGELDNATLIKLKVN